LNVAKRQGYALSNGEFVADLFCVAAPVRDHNNQMVAAMGIGATAADFEINQSALIKEVVRSAQAASRAPGWRPSDLFFSRARLFGVTKGGLRLFVS
jgi:IclR family KDG regulon transcriptional repressor